MNSYFADRVGRGPEALRPTPRYSVGMAYPRAAAAAASKAAEPPDAAAYVAGAGGAWPSDWRPLVHGAGALVSLAMLAGLGIWGYGQVMRDVAGVPVVEAAGGPMRVAPERPGGTISEHAGLTVNAVKAGTPEDALPETIRLAPPPVDLAPEDQPPAAAAAPARRADGGGPRGADAMPALVEANGEAPGLAADSLAFATEQELALAQAVAAAMMSGGVAAASPGAADTGQADTGQADTGQADAGRAEALPVPIVTDLAARGPAAADASGAPAPGTRLVQLGAYASPQEADAAWVALAGRFGPLMERKSAVVQEAEAAGRSLWRLRAQGFEDLAQARRFCAALVAEGADCIPVVAR